MRKNELLILFCLSLLGVGTSKAQEKTTEDFKTSGKPILQSFFDYGQGFGDEKDNTGFDIKRALIGYSYKFTPTISAQVVL